MPQLIAMVIVVVGAIIYMFQTFGGTGDKIEGIAQKTSAITEINNIKNGLKLAARAGHIANLDGDDRGVAGAESGDAVNTLEGLATLEYFQDQINNNLTDDAAVVENTYQAISFGADRSMEITLVTEEGQAPAILVDFRNGSLSDNAGFLEAQISTDLESITNIIRDTTAVTKAANTDDTLTAGGTNTDGVFLIRFSDFGANEQVR